MKLLTLVHNISYVPIECTRARTMDCTIGSPVVYNRMACGSLQQALAWSLQEALTWKSAVGFLT
eukprot:6143742-Lingulodinium_polyedra.AAC.1